jgi:3-vinyl bacteriochlorophyllide hydratase
MEPQTVSGKRVSSSLYTPEQRAKRDATVWTLVQGILAPVQFLVCLISAALVIRFLMTGHGLWVANLSVLIKTVILLTIMVTGSIWEKVVFDEWLFAAPFFWEDVVSMGVIALHLLYVAALFGGWLSTNALMTVALTAYVAYFVNAIQFVLKLRAARLQESESRLQGAIA